MKSKNIFFIILPVLISCSIIASAVVNNPALVINSPPDKYVTNISVITIIGKTDPGAALSLNKKSILNNNGTFLENVTLTEGLNQILVEAQKNGNISQAFVNVTLDTISPDISIISPNQTYINSTSLNLTYTSNASDIKIYRVRLNNSIWNETNKSYYVFNLTEGSAFIEVQAVDYAGNSGETSINFTVDFTPPFIEIIKPAANETIMTRYVDISGRTEVGANISVNGMNLRNDNGTWNITVVLLSANNLFHIESQDLAGNKAEKTISIHLGENLSSVKPFEDFQNLTINFSQLGKFDGNNDAVSGKYVSYFFDRNASVFIGYSIKNTLWFNNIIISGFTAENTSILDSVAKYEQGLKFGEQHHIAVDIHDNIMGTMLLDIRQFEDIYAKAREYLSNKPRERLKINVSLDKNVTIERKSTGNITPLVINESWKAWPEVTFELANNVNVTEINNGFRLTKDNKQAYLFIANYAGGSSNFTIKENKLISSVNNSLLIFRQSQSLGLANEDILDSILWQGISNGIIGAEFFVDSVGSYDVITFANMSISASFPDNNTMELNVSSGSLKGTVLAVGISGKFYNNMLDKNMTISYDGKEIPPAASYQELVNATRAEYLLAMGSNGAMILVSIPSFSSHTISFSFELPTETRAGTFGSKMVDLLNFLSAGLFLALPATSRELTFSLRWFVIVLTLYIILRKAVRKSR